MIPSLTLTVTIYTSNIPPQLRQERSRRLRLNLKSCASTVFPVSLSTMPLMDGPTPRTVPLSPYGVLPLLSPLFPSGVVTTPQHQD